MNQTSMNLRQQDPVLVYKVNTGGGPSALPLDVETELDKYTKVFITKEYDLFKVVSCFEAADRDYKVYVETKEGDKKILFTSEIHSECCNCCEQCILGCFCFAYACCHSIVFQMDYRRNGAPFYTQGYNLTKGCHCCDICIFPQIGCCICPGNKLYLRENIDPDSPDISVGRPKGKTETNCCSVCTDKYAKYTTESNAVGPTVRASCCDICKNNCMIQCLSCCGICNCYAQGFDFQMSIEDQNGIKTGNIMIYSGCCSQKVEGMCCYFPRSYMEVNMPPNMTSEQKFQIIADAIHLDLVNHFF